MKKTLLSLALITAMGMFSGCGDDNSTSPADGTGTLKVLLTDATAAYDAVNVTFSSVMVHADFDSSATDSTTGWIVVSETPQTIDLLTLSNGVTALLGEKELDEEHYTQIRLVISAAEVVIDSVSHELNIPSDTLKFVSGFDIVDGVTTELAIDFDVERSVHQTGSGQYILKPTVRLIQTALSGSIGGTVTNYTDLPVAYAISGADTVTSTPVDSGTGQFTLAFLPAGTYTVAVSDTLGQAYSNSAVAVTLGVKTSLGDITLQ